MRLARLNYPQIALDRVIKYLEDHREEVLASEIIARNDALVILGFKPRSGAGETVAGSLVRYGLLDKTDDKYKFSESAKLILEQPNKSSVKKRLILEAAQKPPIFSGLWQLEDRLGHLEISEAEKLLIKHYIPRDKFKHVLKNFKLTRLFYVNLGGKTEDPESTTPYMPVEAKNDADSGKKMDIGPTVRIDFNGVPLDVPKRLILNAYLEWIQEVKNQLESKS